MAGFDWPSLMRAGLHGLRLHPDEFWALTPVELQMMLGARSGNQPMNRTRLDDLIRAYPDNIKGSSQ